MRIFLADLGHNQLTVSSDVYPLGVANLAAYVSADESIADRIDVSIFREPEHLKAAIDDDAPDVLGLSSYSWNHNLSLHFASYAKARHPGLITLMGGPNFPLTEGEQETVLRGMPQIDVAVRGPTYEGERAFRNVVRRLVEVAGRLEGLIEEAVPGNLWIHPKTGDFVMGEEVERIHDLDEIPSPYRMGLLEPFFATGYFPMMQIARGCPFSCAFCNSSVASNSRIYRHSVENVKDDLLYVAERIRPELTLCFADDNFGMYALDEEIADFIGFLQDRYGWPRYIRTTTGKNKHERIIRVMRKIRGGLPMTAAVQSMDPQVLANIARSNIKLDAYAEIQKEILAQGMQAYGELIICLPGETKATFMKAVHDLMHTGVKRISAHQLMLLHGAPLSNPDSREKWQFSTRFRVVARNIGNYTGEPVIETEEVVVSTPTFSFEEYLETRVFHLLLTIFYYEGNFEEAFEFARLEGVSPFDLVVTMQSMLDRAPEGFGRVIDDYVRENQDELFDSPEACLAWACEHFDGLVAGTEGGNLLSKYSMLGRFYTTADALDFLHECILEALGSDVSPRIAEQLHTVMSYLRCTLLHAPFIDSLAATPEWTTAYDLESWSRDGYTRRLEEYEFPNERRFATTVEADRRAALETRIRTFGEHPSGLGKFTRTMFARDLRRSVVADAASEARP
jgi:radical SAM superfamily enzyme YgiQ (UPF0313 family)